MKMDGRDAPTVVHGPLGIIYYQKEKANVIANFLENQFISHHLCDENHERQAETRIQVLLASVDVTLLGKTISCDTQK
jgi:hypothetical protein